MKKISLLLAFLTCATVTHNSFTISSADPFASEMPSSYPPQERDDKQEQKEEKDNQYDFQRELRKFKEKNKDKDYTNHPLYKKEPLYPRNWRFADNSLK